jgi:Methyltransferase domain
MLLKHRLADFLGSLLVPVVAWFLKRARFNMAGSPRVKAALLKGGVFPLVDHFHEPLIDASELRDLDVPRQLTAIDFNGTAQAALLEAFPGDDSVTVLFETATEPNSFRLNNGYFENGDADLWFRVIQHFRPHRIIEIGCGHSTKVAQLAISHLKRGNKQYQCEHTCIDPNAAQWLDQLGPRIIRKKVEKTSLQRFSELKSGDILFIDSSHVIKPQGDVLFEYLQILPTLAPGVIVHIHDMFTPRDYPAEWLQGRQYFWNEQYLVEAFLCNNSNWEILLAANMLMHDHFELFKSKCPSLDAVNVPRSFYIRRVST